MCLKSSVFVASDVAPILCNILWIFTRDHLGRDYSNLRHLKMCHRTVN